jgi:hypothetical protein
MCLVNWEWSRRRRLFLLLLLVFVATSGQPQGLLLQVALLVQVVAAEAEDLLAFFRDFTMI